MLLQPFWRLTFQDEFNGTELSTVWNASPYNSRLRLPTYYADDAVEVSNGILKICAREQEIAGCNYVSGRLESRDSFWFERGYFEIRAKMPLGRGFWPAFWLYRFDQPGWQPEIDVFEHLGEDPNTVYMANHWDDGSGSDAFICQSYAGPDFTADFHVFAAEWNRDEIIWYVDGVERHRTSEGVPGVSLFMIINLMVGGSWPEPPDETTPFPSCLEVDYVRVYQGITIPTMFRRL